MVVLEALSARTGIAIRMFGSKRLPFVGSSSERIWLWFLHIALALGTSNRSGITEDHMDSREIESQK